MSDDYWLRGLRLLIVSRLRWVNWLSIGSWLAVSWLSVSWLSVGRLSIARLWLLPSGNDHRSSVIMIVTHGGDPLLFEQHVILASSVTPPDEDHNDNESDNSTCNSTSDGSSTGAFRVVVPA